MAVALLYGKFLNSLARKRIDFSADTFKVMLTTSAYTPNQDTHEFKSDVTNEVAGAGYTATGVTLTPITITYDAATNTIIIDGPDAVWASLTLTTRWGVLYDSTPATDATRPLIGFIDFGSDQVLSASPFSIIWDASGITRLTAAA